MNQQITYIRSLACIMVVLVHSTALFYIDSISEFDNIIAEYINQLSRIGTPLFCVITGFLFSKYYFNGLDLKRFIKSRFDKIIIPYFFWSFFYVILTYFFAKNIFPENLIYSFIFGETFYHLYFISVIIQFCFVFPILCTLSKKNDFLILILFLVFNLFSLNFILENDYYLFSTRSFLGNWIFYFFFGIFFLKYFNFHIGIKFSIFILLIIFSLICCEIYFSNNIFTSTRLLNLIYVPVVFTLFYNILKKIKFLILEKIGVFSMGIYFIHPIILIGLDRFFGNKIDYNNYLSVFLVFIIALTISGILTLCISKTKYSKYIVTIPRVK